MTFTDQCSLCPGEQHILTFYTKCVTPVVLEICCFTEEWSYWEWRARIIHTVVVIVSWVSRVPNTHSPHRKKVMQKATGMWFLEVSEVHHCSYVCRPMKWSHFRSSERLFICEKVSTKLTSLHLGLVNWLGFDTKSKQVRISVYGTPSCHFAVLLWVEFQFFDYL